MLDGVETEPFQEAANSAGDLYTERNLTSETIPRCAVQCVLLISTLLPLLSSFVCLSPQHYPHMEHEGRLVLLSGLSRDVKYIQDNIKGCHCDGCDSVSPPDRSTCMLGDFGTT